MDDRETIQILDAVAMDRTLSRMAHEILENNKGSAGLALVGIRSRGVPLARRLAAKMNAIEAADIPVGTLDINLYRDDLSTIADHPVLHASELPFALDGRRLILVDDVLFTGRTIRAALDALIDHGRPASIRLAVLIDRGHRDLPIRADIVGRDVRTSLKQRVRVELQEIDGADRVTILPLAEGGRP